MKKLIKMIGIPVVMLFYYLPAKSQLCLTWVSWTATKNGNCAVDLAWSYHHCSPGVFYVEYSTDASTYYPIKTIASTGCGCGSTENYSYTDNNACPGTGGGNVYYRIRYVNDNGVNYLSTIKSINMNTCGSCSNNHTTRCSGLSTSISGSSTICFNSSQDYTMSGNHPATWTIPTGSGLVSYGSTPATLGVSNTGSTGYIVINANVYGCASYNKTVALGAPAVANFPLMIYSGPGDENEVCQGEENIFYGDITPNSTITWTTTYASPGGISATGYGYDDLYLYMWKPNQTAIIRLDATNSCGTTTYDFAFKTIDCSFRFMITPNPSKGDINIVVANSHAKGAASRPISKPLLANTTAITKVIIYDLSKNIIMQRTYNNQSKVNLQNQDLKPGVYFVTVYNGTYSETHRVLIQ